MVLQVYETFLRFRICINETRHQIFSLCVECECFHQYQKLQVTPPTTMKLNGKIQLEFQVPPCPLKGFKHDETFGDIQMSPLTVFKVAMCVNASV